MWGRVPHQQGNSAACVMAAVAHPEICSSMHPYTLMLAGMTGLQEYPCLAASAHHAELAPLPAGTLFYVQQLNQPAATAPQNSCCLWLW